eukprot:4061394-Pleurochrysis_carterae.AAC.1
MYSRLSHSQVTPVHTSAGTSARISAINSTGRARLGVPPALIADEAQLGFDVGAMAVVSSFAEAPWFVENVDMASVSFGCESFGALAERWSASIERAPATANGKRRGDEEADEGDGGRVAEQVRQVEVERVGCLVARKIVRHSDGLAHGEDGEGQRAGGYH